MTSSLIKIYDRTAVDQQRQGVWIEAAQTRGLLVQSILQQYLGGLSVIRALKPRQQLARLSQIEFEHRFLLLIEMLMISSRRENCK